MTSITGICNRGLQGLGAARILDISDDTRNGRACNASYNSVRRAELRKHTWRFSITREVLAPLTETDPHGEYAYVFQLPAKCLRVIKPKDPYLDWHIEGRKLYTSLSNVLKLKYIKDEEDPDQFDALFAELLSSAMSLELCEEITGSNSKKEILLGEYRRAISEAKRMNAFETIPAEPEEDSWLLARL